MLLLTDRVIVQLLPIAVIDDMVLLKQLLSDYVSVVVRVYVILL